MGKVAVVTDSNSGITQQQGKELGIYVLPMPFYINDKLFFEDVTLSQEEFYQHLSSDADVKTTQPAPGDVTDLWDRVLQDYDELVHIPMSSGLSSSCETAIMLSQDYDGRVQVADVQRISVTMRQSVLDALAMAQLEDLAHLVQAHRNHKVAILELGVGLRNGVIKRMLARVANACEHATYIVFNYSQALTPDASCETILVDGDMTPAFEEIVRCHL